MNADGSGIVNRPDVDRRFRWVYGRAHYGRTLLWHSSEMLFGFFLNQRAGMSPQLMGVVLCAGLVLSAIIDVVVAHALRKMPFTLERTQRLQLAGAMLSSLAFMIFFAADLIAPSFRFPYILCAAILFRIAYAVGDIPHNAILSLATATFESRRQLATIRLFFSGLASITIAGPLTLVIASPMLARPGIFLLNALWVSVVVIATAMQLANYPIRPPEPQCEAAQRVPVPAKRGMSPHAARLLLMMGLLCSAITAYTILEPFYVASRQGDTAKNTIILASSLGLAVAQPVWARICRNWAPRSIITLTVGVMILSLVGFGLLDGTAHTGQPLLSFLFGVANGGIGMAMWSAYAEEVARRDVSHDPMAFALLTCFAKLGSACATILISLSLFHEDGAVSPLAMSWGPAGVVTIVLMIHLLRRNAASAGNGRTIP